VPPAECGRDEAECLILCLSESTPIPNSHRRSVKAGDGDIINVIDCYLIVNELYVL